MKNIHLLALLTLFVTPVQAASYNSHLGFKLDLDKDWLVINKDKSSPENRGKTLEQMKALGIKDERARAILQRISNSHIEFIFDKKHSNKDFINNISISRDSGTTARTHEQGKAACKTLGAELNKVFKKDIKVSQCGIKSIDKSLYMSYEYTGAIADIVTIQNEFQITPNLTLITVAGASPSAANHIRKTQQKIARAIVKYIKSSPDYFDAASKAMNALKSNKYKTAYKHLRILASAGDPEGLFNIAVFNEHGKATKKDLKTAFNYYQKAARLGHRFAITKLGDFYLNGKTVKKNPEKAAKLFYQGGLLGDPIAQNMFATMLFNGIGVKQKNPQEALKWFAQSAKQGYQPAAKNLVQIYESEIKNKNTSANHGLAMLYLQGIGVKQNTDKAIKLLEKAAFDGVDESRQALHEIYTKGLFGIAKNQEKAKIWKKQ